MGLIGVIGWLAGWVGVHRDRTTISRTSSASSKQLHYRSGRRSLGQPHKRRAELRTGRMAAARVSDGPDRGGE